MHEDDTHNCMQASQIVSRQAAFLGCIKCLSGLHENDQSSMYVCMHVCTKAYFKYDIWGAPSGGQFKRHLGQCMVQLRPAALETGTIAVYPGVRAAQVPLEQRNACGSMYMVLHARPWFPRAAGRHKHEMETVQGVVRMCCDVKLFVGRQFRGTRRSGTRICPTLHAATGKEAHWWRRDRRYKHCAYLLELLCAVHNAVGRRASLVLRVKKPSLDRDPVL